MISQLQRRHRHQEFLKFLKALEKDIRAWIENWNENPRPFAWTKTAEEIPDSLAKYIARISGGGH